MWSSEPFSLVVPTGGAAATTWSPTDIWNAVSGVLSFTNNDCTVTVTVADQFAGRAAASLGTGKYYWETDITLLTGDFNIGVVDSSALNGRFLKAEDNPSHGAALTILLGAYHNVGSANDSAFPVNSLVSGDTIDIAFDGTASKIWFRRNNFAWNELLADQDPGTGHGGLQVVLTESPPILAAWGMAGDIGNNFTSRFAKASWLRTFPDGFDQINA